MINTKIFVASFGSKTNEFLESEIMINLKILHVEAGTFEHHEYALRFIEQLKIFIEIFQEKEVGKSTPIASKEFFEWLMKQQFLN